MGKEITTTIIINAVPEKVWAILINFNNYSSWNPLIRSVKGQVKIGNTLEVKIEPPGGKAMTFKPKVITYTVNKELSWLGQLMFAGIFDGKHTFELIDNKDGTTTFNQSEYFTGLLVPLFKKMFEKNTRDGFNLMNKELKSMAEKT